MTHNGELFSNGFDDFSSDFFLIKPFSQISNLVIERKTKPNIVEVILQELYNFFLDKKEYRTISDVDQVLKILEPIFQEVGYNLESLTDEEKEERSRDIIQEFENFIDMHQEEIEKSCLNPDFEPFLSDWILNLDTSMKIFSETFELFEIKKRRMERFSKRGIKKLFERLMDLMKALFLVLYRITEQIFILLKKLPYTLDDELDYLLNDVIYLENIQRFVIKSFS
ncbi:hypothetical protein LCGC14_1391440 [marine sediment metagenome]|uniref:Uncharacterized protein n=1 Tax=marine sediment metagenome TaxID=412755 RepID=A0A0F9KKP5_9ZZZZ|nr:MAG: hypothetical protein Lokiarch_40680 [Candidatus Lokiarchaeum sp. GC14_75]